MISFLRFRKEFFSEMKIYGIPESERDIRPPAPIVPGGQQFSHPDSNCCRVSGYNDPKQTARQQIFRLMQ